VCKSLASFFFLALVAGAVLTACHPTSRDRPLGYFRLGKLDQLAATPETFLQNLGLLLRRDERGFYVMSTMSTYDLSLLSFKQAENARVLVSSESESVFAEDGRVLKGPAVEPLPYYEIQFDESEYGGPKDSLYAYVGRIKPKDWRLRMEDLK
jgi:hypothetical protein